MKIIAEKIWIPMRRLTIIALLLLGSCLSCSKEKPAMEAQPLEVVTVTIEPKTIPAEFQYVGVMESSHMVEIRARVAGYLEEISFQEGSFVKQGDLLFKIDPKPFDASLAIAKGELARQEAILSNAITTRDRLEPLYKEKAASKRDLDNAVSQVTASEAAVYSAKASVTQAELNLSYTTVTSPVSGLISSSNLREGALIDTSTLMTTMSVVNPIWVNYSVSDRDLLKFRSDIEKKRLAYPSKLDFTVELTLADGSHYPLEGRVNFAEPTLDLATGTMLIRAVFENPNRVLLPGQFVRVTVKGATYPDAIVIPQKAVLQGQKGMFVYVVDKDNRAQIRMVEPGDWFDEDWIINSGLQKGDQVIIDGVNRIQPDMPVIRKK
jgi:membrane fusion protein, multidrug efflux system